MTDFPKYYNRKFKSDNKTIKRHHSKYPNDIFAPAWKTLEYLTFGSVITLYLSLGNKALKETISNRYGIRNLNVFENYLLTILFIRNICAHSDLLFDSNTPKAIKPTPLLHFNNNSRHSLDSSIKVICYFLKQISVSRCDKITLEIDDLFNSLKRIWSLSRLSKIKWGMYIKTNFVYNMLIFWPYISSDLHLQ